MHMLAGEKDTRAAQVHLRSGADMDDFVFVRRGQGRHERPGVATHGVGHVVLDFQPFFVCHGTASVQFVSKVGKDIRAA